MRIRLSSIAVAAGAALVLAGCGSSVADEPPAETSAATSSTAPAVATSTEPTTTVPPATTSEAPEITPPETTTEAPPTSLVDVEYQRNESYYFTSPDGAFQCGIVRLPSRTEAGCEGTTDPVPPRPDNCVVNWGHGIRVQDTGPGEFLCSGGPVYLSPDGASPALPAGSTLSELGYTCTTSAADVTCTNDTTGSGFTVAADSNETF